MEGAVSIKKAGRLLCPPHILPGNLCQGPRQIA
jgi:hypothetical protein